MNSIKIEDLFPEPNRDNYERLKREHPFNILSRYAQAIGLKYPGKLDGIITESTDVSKGNLINYAFYISAAIGKGYTYRLLDVTPTTIQMYPLRVVIFEKNPQELNLVQDYLQFENLLNDIIRMGFTQTLLLNLVTQVDLYIESRSE